MPRTRRRYAPGSITHVISRFAHDEFRLDTERDRRACLDHVGRALQVTDWTLLCYGLMSSHLHWGFLAGHDELWRFAKPVNTALAHRLNDRQGRSGCVFRDRPRTVHLESALALRLVAYIHNNPVRAGVVSSAQDSRWTSHRAYLGLEPAPRWLDVEAALRLCGFDASDAGRRAFDAEVRSRAAQPRDPVLSGDCIAATRVAVRRIAGSGTEIGAPAIGREGDRVEVELFAPRGAALRQVWDGRLDWVVRAVAEACGVAVGDLVSGERRRAVVHARRIVVWTAHRLLGRSLTEVAASVAISRQSAGALIAPARMGGAARRVGERVATAILRESADRR